MAVGGGGGATLSYGYNSERPCIQPLLGPHTSHTYAHISHLVSKGVYVLYLCLYDTHCSGKRRMFADDICYVLCYNKNQSVLSYQVQSVLSLSLVHQLTSGCFIHFSTSRNYKYFVFLFLLLLLFIHYKQQNTNTRQQLVLR